MISKPISVYINWAAYDELSDAIELTEEIAMKQFTELIRLRKTGVRFDCYMMDAFWYDLAGGYRTWRKPHWPQGPDRWLKACLDQGVTPGLWFSGNTLCHLELAKEWAESLDEEGRGMCLFHGGFLAHWMESIRIWFIRGIRVIKIDFMDFTAAPTIVRRHFLPAEIRAMNVAAFREALSALRDQCPEIIIMGYNGLEEAETQFRTDSKFRKTIDPRWLDVFDSLYCGDPRPSDVPAMNFWRSKDVYSDHMVRVYQRNGFPLSRIDNAGFMIGTTGTCFFRKTASWQGMLILSLARGGWMNTYYGNLDLLSNEQGAWFAKVQSMFFKLQSYGRISTFGGMPGEARPYGYVAESAEGSLITVVNPAQATEIVPLPALPSGTGYRVLFYDSGPVPAISEGGLKLGPEQMALIGMGCYNDSAYELSRQDHMQIPSSIEPLLAEFKAAGDKVITTTVMAPKTGCIRVALRILDRTAKGWRLTGGAPPNGITLGKMLTIEAEQEGRPVPLQINYDKAIWSGLSWGVAELNVGSLRSGAPVTIRCSTTEKADVELSAQLYHTIYAEA